MIGPEIITDIGSPSCMTHSKFLSPLVSAVWLTHWANEDFYHSSWGTCYYILSSGCSCEICSYTFHGHNIRDSLINHFYATQSPVYFYDTAAVPPLMIMRSSTMPVWWLVWLLSFWCEKWPESCKIHRFGKALTTTPGENSPALEIGTPDAQSLMT